MQKVLRGILFHFGEFGYSVQFDSDYFEAMAVRLEHLKTGIKRSVWDCFDDRQRLVWMMKQIDCAVALDDDNDVAYIAAKDIENAPDDNPE